ncbi:MAG: hypothetical protein ACR2G4_00450 [Pyrinomonadaceae bacterium]
MNKEEQNKQETTTPQSLPPAIEVRWAAYGKLTLYPVDESELELLAQGSPDSLYLNFAVFLLSVSVSFLTALLTAVVSNKVFTVFVVITTLGFIVGLFLMILWFRKRRSVSEVVDKIKKRLPPEGIQEK